MNSDTSLQQQTVTFPPAHLSDLTLLCDGTRYCVHKVILATDSKVWQDAFTSDRENKNTATLTQTEGETLDLTGRRGHTRLSLTLFLRAVYNRVHNQPLPSGSLSTLTTLLDLAHFYNCPSLQNECENCIRQSLLAWFRIGWLPVPQPEVKTKGKDGLAKQKQEAKLDDEDEDEEGGTSSAEEDGENNKHRRQQRMFPGGSQSRSDGSSKWPIVSLMQLLDCFTVVATHHRDAHTALRRMMLVAIKLATSASGPVPTRLLWPADDTLRQWSLKHDGMSGALLVEVVEAISGITNRRLFTRRPTVPIYEPRQSCGDFPDLYGDPTALVGLHILVELPCPPSALAAHASSSSSSSAAGTPSAAGTVAADRSPHWAEGNVRGYDRRTGTHAVDIVLDSQQPQTASRGSGSSSSSRDRDRDRECVSLSLPLCIVEDMTLRWRVSGSPFIFTPPALTSPPPPPANGGRT